MDASTRAAAATSLGLCAFFIWRARFEIDGETWFSLFDDALISMRYARNLALGLGLIWNPGEAPVEGYTNFLWTLWMAVLHLAGAPDSKISLLVRASGALLVAANVGLVGAIARRLCAGAPRARQLAVWLTALSYPNLIWGISGLEVAAISLCTSWAVLEALRLREAPRLRTLGALGLALGLGLLTRSDFALPAGVVAAFAVASAPRGFRRAAALALGAAILGTLAAHTAFRASYYGDLLPNAYYLKLAGAPLGARLTRGLVAFGGAVQTGLFLPLAFGAAALLLGRARRPSGVLLLAAVFAAPCLYSVWVGGDAWEFLHYPNRYIAPGLPLLLVLCAQGIHALAAAEWRARRSAVLLALLLAAALPLLEAALARLAESAKLSGLGLPLEAHFWQVFRDAMGGLAAASVLATGLGIPAARRAGLAAPRDASLRGAAFLALAAAALLGLEGEQATSWARSRGEPNSASARIVRLALAIRDATAPEARVAVVWAGGVPYFSQRPAIDLLGRNDRVIARGERRAVPFYPGHDKWNYGYSIGQLRPDVIAQLWRKGEPEFRALRSWGYARVHPELEPFDLYVHAGSTRVDAGRLRRWVCAQARAAAPGEPDPPGC